jgi:hypothetical protein
MQLKLTKRQVFDRGKIYLLQGLVIATPDRNSTKSATEPCFQSSSSIQSGSLM